MWSQEEIILSNIETIITSEISSKQAELIKFEQEDLIAPKIENLDLLPNKDLLEICTGLLIAAKNEIRDAIQKQVDCLNDCHKKTLDVRGNWNQLHNKKKEELNILLSNLENNGVPIKNYQEYLRLEQEKQRLESMAQQVDTHVADLSLLSADRIALLEKLINVRKRIYLRRLELIRNINHSLRGFVRIKIKENGDNSKYRELLVDTILSSSKIRINKDDRVKIADNIEPLDLCNIIKNRDSNSLVTKTHISGDVAGKTLILAQGAVFELEIVELEDRITIELNDHSWKEISKCSDGQKCTTILAIAMCERDFPLIIDQPEDSLDNSFIYSQVVKILREIKNHRQLIIATHNANIPVLGDAELILVMRSNGLNGFVNDRGVIDKDTIKTHVQTILEGG
ncbi:hypothetical protein [Methanoculleus chikugoensis]|uniref:hypothetical protein n=1 Tax=Methanoculleus chikugoensis TaxID=118126 RepID=UPI000AA11539|nr:hypothetical protein [Methanoculleus chikugoensis]